MKETPCGEASIKWASRRHAGQPTWTSTGSDFLTRVSRRRADRAVGAIGWGAVSGLWQRAQTGAGVRVTGTGDALQ